MAVEALFLRGKEAADRKNYDYAITLFRDVLRADPAHRAARIALRGCEMERFRERGGGAKAKATALLSGLGSLLKIAIQRKDPEKVIAACEDYLANDPTNVGVLVSLAQAHQQLGQLDAAADTLEFARQRAPAHLGVLRSLAEVHYAQGQYDKAIRCYQEILTLRPSDREASERVRNIAAESHLKRSGLEQAQSYREALRDEDKARGLEQEGRVARTADDLDQEVARRRKAVEEKPGDAEAHQALGDACLRAGQYAEAEAAYRKAFEIGKKWPAREKLGDAHLRLLEHAERAAEKEAEEGGREPALVARAREAKQKRLEFAVKEYEFRRKQHPTDATMAWQLGLYYCELGGEANVQRAIQQFQQAMNNTSYKTRAQLMLGRCFALNPKTLDMAKEQFTRAYEGLEEDRGEMAKSLLYELGAVSEKMNNRADAVAWYKKIFAVDAGYRNVAKKIQELG